jgi:flagellar protein FlgJ
MSGVQRCASLVLAALIVATAPALGPPPAQAAGITATVRTAGVTLNARSGPSTADRVVRTIPNGTRLAVRCQVYGQAVSGQVRRSAYWNRLTDGSYVTNAYVAWSPRAPFMPWCAGASATVASVSTSGRLTVRSGPRTTNRKVGSLANGTRLVVGCQAWGSRVAGSVRTSPLWYRLGAGRYISAAFVRWAPGVPAVPYCGQAPHTVPTTNAGFVARVAGGARAGHRRYGVPASVTIAQAILESGWGRSGLTRRDHNYFGIKCFGTPGGIAIGCRTYGTHECNSRTCWATSAQFRAYWSPYWSIVDHGNFLRVNSRYRNAFRYSRNPDQFVREIHKAGYATSPTYSTNLIGIMRRYALYRYDR